MATNERGLKIRSPRPAESQARNYVSFHVLLLMQASDMLDDQ